MDRGAFQSRALLSTLGLCFGLLTADFATGQQGAPSLTMRFEGAGQVSGLPGSRVLIPCKVILDIGPVPPGGPPGVAGWSLGVQAASASCRIVRASTVGTVCVPVAQGGIGVNFDDTQLTEGPGNEGAVSACVLPIGTFLEPGSHPVLSLTVEAVIPQDQRCVDCLLQLVSGLEGTGDPVRITTSYNNRSIVPQTQSKTIRLCPARCFDNESHTLDWGQWLLGEAFGTARQQDCYETCTVASGYGGTADSVQLLSRAAASEFEATVAVSDLRVSGGVGEETAMAGLEARAFTGTAGNPASPYIAAYVRSGPNGGLEVASSVRREPGGRTEFGRSIALQQLPVTLRVRGRGGVLAVEFSRDGGRTFEEPLLELETSGGNHRVGMVHASGGEATSTAVFCNPRLEILGSTLGELPRLAPSAIDRRGILEGKIALAGRNLEEIVEVLIGGKPVEFDREGDVLIFDPRPFTPPTIADILIRTPAGSVRIPDGLVNLGGDFIRCDCDGDGIFDITDNIVSLTRLFLGGRPCQCPQAADCNRDTVHDITDPILGLTKLFLGGVNIPAPHPDPGPSATGELICGVEGLPDEPSAFRVLDRQGNPLQSLRTGDVFRIVGRNFSEVPENNIVMAGDAQLEVIEASEQELLVEVGMIITDRVIADIFIGGFDITDILAPFICPGECKPDPVLPFFKIPLPEPIPTIPDFIDPIVILGTAEVMPGGNRAGVEIPIDLDGLARQSEVNVAVAMPLPAIQDVSPGGISTNINLAFGPRASAEEKLVELTGALRRELQLDETIAIVADPEGQRLLIEPTPLTDAVLTPEFFEDFFISIYGPPIGRCGPENLHPILDERAFAWCRMEQILQSCGGLPTFEWWIPEQFVRSPDENPVIPLPNNRSPFMKSVMYNMPAYCHVRENELWNRCKQEELTELAGGPTAIPPFPRAAWVLKTSWTSSLPGGADPDDFYSYTESGSGTTWYLLALHHTTKDINDWVWMDLYPASISTSTIGGCGGRNDDIPAGLVGTVWENYLLCTNVTHTQPFTEVAGPPFESAWCGNYQFPPECPEDSDGYDTCLNCHDGSTSGAATSGCCSSGAISTTPDGDLDLDFLYSLSNLFNSLPRVPDPCDAVEEGSDYDLDIQPIWNAHCVFCHSGGSPPEGLNLSAGVSYGNLVNVVASQPAPAMDRIEPFSTANSYLWHKIEGTQGSVGGSGCRMPRPCASAPLPNSDRTTIQAWINNGAPN